MSSTRPLAIHSMATLSKPFLQSDTASPFWHLSSFYIYIYILCCIVLFSLALTRLADSESAKMNKHIIYKMNTLSVALTSMPNPNCTRWSMRVLRGIQALTKSARGSLAFSGEDLLCAQVQTWPTQFSCSSPGSTVSWPRPVAGCRDPKGCLFWKIAELAFSLSKDIWT